jgi:hypothetical protein
MIDELGEIEMDWNSIVIASILTIPPTLMGLATLIQGIRTHKTFNSKMDAMLELTEKAAFAAGQKAGKEAAK